MGAAFTNAKYSLWTGSICAFYAQCGWSVFLWIFYDLFSVCLEKYQHCSLYLTENDLLLFSAIGHLNFVEQKLKVSKSYMYIKFVFYTRACTCRSTWASYQIREIVGCACARNAGNVFPATDFKGNRELAIPACITARASRTCRDACRDR